MKALILSDLHMGDGTGSDEFMEQDYKILNFIGSIAPDSLYLNGDIFELWKCKMKNIRSFHYTLTKFVDGEYVHGMIFPEVIRIKGNHDYTLFGKMKVEITTKSGKKILITHGFQNDPWMTNPISRFFTWCLGRVEKLIPDIDNVFSASKRINNKANEYAMQQLTKYDIVILGHTHKIECKQYLILGRFVTYANSGTCTNGKLQGILIDTETDEIKVV